MAKDEVSWTQMKKYLNMPESKFFTMMDKAHPEWKVKSTLISKKKDYALKVAKYNTEYMDSEFISEFAGVESRHALKAGKNKGKAKLTYNVNKTVYLPADMKTLTNYFKKLKQDKYKWLVSRGNLAGLKTYDFDTWLPMFSMFQGNGGSSDSIANATLKSNGSGSPRSLIDALANAHHGVKLDGSDKRELKAWGLTNVKPVVEVKKPTKKKTTTKKKKAPAKKKTVRRVRKAPTKKKTTTKKKKAPAKKKTVRRVRKAPAKKKTTRRKK